MSTPLRFRSGNRPGRNFQLKHPPNAEMLKEGGVRFGLLTTWSAVAVRSVKKHNWQDSLGNWRDSVYFYELTPADEENKIELDEFFVEGRFRIVHEEHDVQRALAKWHAFQPQ